MTRFLVTIARRGQFKTVQFRGHRVQAATIGVAALHRGWAVVEVMQAIRRKGELTAAKLKKWRQRPLPGASAEAHISPHRLPVRLILEPGEIRQFRAELDHRQEIRRAANLPLLDQDAEIERFIEARVAAEYRERLQPYLMPILAATIPTGGMVATMVRHYRAQQEARGQLFRAEGLVPP